MNYVKIKKHDIANGPGVRVSLYVSGCTRHCRNCFNPETWDFSAGSPFDRNAEDEIIEALKVACAWDFVSQFPNGIHHSLGAGGRGISEGQAQRLAIARALLRKAPILLLDEATSGLDVATERQLLENLRQCSQHHTCVLVTHRPESARFCNRTYEIHRRQVTEVTDGI